MGIGCKMIHFFLMVNKHGQTRLADYFGPKCAPGPRAAPEADWEVGL